MTIKMFMEQYYRGKLFILGSLEAGLHPRTGNQINLEIFRIFPKMTQNPKIAPHPKPRSLLIKMKNNRYSQTQKDLPYRSLEKSL